MQSEKEDTDDEPHSQLWGLDPVFSVFAKLYIRDILSMRESHQVPGIYFYKSHPIYKVDVLGVVVFKKEREDFFCYGVDDGTGVINSLCWKDEKWRRQDEALTSPGVSLVPVEGGFNPLQQLGKLKHAQRLSSQLEIGDLLRVRGAVKTYRQQREITASIYYKVKDPKLEVQISWMMEVPQLYGKVYDRPFEFTPKKQDPDVSSPSAFPFLLRRACQTLKDLLRQQRVESFRPKDVQPHLMRLVTQSSSQQDPAVAQSLSKETHQLFQETMKVLQDEGLVFRRVISQDEVYQVTVQDMKLRSLTKNIIKKDCKREKYAERGCHTLHILSCVRQAYSLNVSKAAVEVVLRSLESDSEIISTAENYYTLL